MSGVPIVDYPDRMTGERGKLLDMYSRIDAIAIAARGAFDDLDVPIEDALLSSEDRQVRGA